MFLEYGVAEHGELVHIDQAPRGLSSLVCPYCNGPLIARKGQVLAHHFAHAGETCRDVAERDDNAVRLPMYDRFDLELPGRVWEALQRFHQDQTYSWQDLELLKHYELVEDNPFAYQEKYQLTHVGKIPFGETTLSRFAEIQEQLIEQKLDELEAQAERARGAPTLQACLSDLRLYRAQLRRVLSTTLYFLEITFEGGSLYKVGVTNRGLDERIAEVKRDLAPRFRSVQVEPLRSLEHRGAVELYFKHRYRKHQLRLGSLTEYFQLDHRRNVLSDLTRLGDKELTFTESEILAGKPADIERHLTAEAKATARIAAIRQGMERAVQEGAHVGRPLGSTESREQFLAKYPQVIAALRAGLSLRQAAKQGGVSVNTVRKVKVYLEDLDRHHSRSSV